MKITKTQLRQIIKEERQKLLAEQHGYDADNALIEFANTFARMDRTMQEQVTSLIEPWVETGSEPGALDEEFVDAVMQLNPRIIEGAVRMLVGPLDLLLRAGENDDARAMLDILQAAATLNEEM